MLILMGTQTAPHKSAQEREELDRLLSGVAAGDREALSQLYGRTRAAVYGLALSYLKNVSDAQDVTQDTFVRVWDTALQYQSQGSPLGWLLAMARNLALMKLRQGTRTVLLDEEQWQAIPADDQSVSYEDRQVLQTALATLDTQERQVVILHAITGLKHREIATLLEMPLATVLSKYHRALKKLKNHLKGDDTP